MGDQNTYIHPALRVLLDPEVSKSAIPSRHELVALTGSDNAGKLLQQIAFHWNQKHGAPFYKFKEPCAHELYRQGDSWNEELLWGKARFDNALKVIGTKVKGKKVEGAKVIPGVSKKSLYAMDKAELPIRQTGESIEKFGKGFADLLKCVVIYWTDSDRVTWYDINPNLLSRFVNRIYLDKSYSLLYLKRAVAGFTFSSETTPETTSTKDSSALRAVDDFANQAKAESAISPGSNNKPNKQAERGKPASENKAQKEPTMHQQFVDAILKAFERHPAFANADMPGSLAGRLAKWFLGKDKSSPESIKSNPLTLIELRGFFLWSRRRADVLPYVDMAHMEQRIVNFRASAEHDQAVADVPRLDRERAIMAQVEAHNARMAERDSASSDHDDERLPEDDPIYAELETMFARFGK